MRLSKVSEFKLLGFFELAIVLQASCLLPWIPGT